MTDAEFEDLLTRLDALVTEFEQHPDPVTSARALEMIQLVDAVHRAGLGQLVALIRRRDPKLLEDASQDRIMRILLALYDLEPGGDPVRGAFVPLSQLQASARLVRAHREDPR